MVSFTQMQNIVKDYRKVISNVDAMIRESGFDDRQTVKKLTEMLEKEAINHNEKDLFNLVDIDENETILIRDNTVYHRGV